MPYVSVYVDPEPCDGSCTNAKELRALQAKIDEAERLIRAGYFDAALHALTNGPALPIKSPEEIASKYHQWKQGKLSGFANPIGG
jgi:hypothetical protein